MKNQAKNRLLGEFHFSFNKGLMLLVIVMLPILVSLGFWQLDRAEQKKQMQVAMDVRFSQTSTDVCDVVKHTAQFEPIQYLPVSINANMTKQYYLIDNQVHKGKVGYELIQMANACNETFLISRGFILGNLDRRILPEVDLHADSQVTLEGYLYQPEHNRFVEQETFAIEHQWPLRIGQANIAQMTQYSDTGFNVFPAIVRIKESQPLLLAAHWNLLSMKPAKHIAYAIQWFALAIMVVIFFIYSGLIRTAKPNETKMKEKSE